MHCKAFNLLRLIGGKFAQPAGMTMLVSSRSEGSAVAVGKEEGYGGHNPTHGKSSVLNEHKSVLATQGVTFYTLSSPLWHLAGNVSLGE